MSGISHLYDLYHKKGKEFIDNLFDTYVTVNEKMDGSAFIFERDIETGKFNFYKRDQRNPITMVDRTLMKYYEKPIKYIETLSPEIVNHIPRGWKFGFEYFSNNAPIEIVYDEIPKNNLILSYIHKKDKSTIQDKNMLDNWANYLGVQKPPIIFQGVLNEEQKDKIMDFLRTPFNDLIKEYKTKSFVAFIIGVLNPGLSKTALNYDTQKPIEGIVFRFGEGDNAQEPVLAKMVDPIFTEIAKEKAKKRIEDKPSDFLGIAILDIMNFILENDVSSFDIEGNTEDEKYISFISDVFADFLDSYAYKYKGVDLEEPEYLKKEEFKLNKDLIKNRRVLKYLESDDAFEALYKLILNSFRKIKKRPSGIITQEIIDQFNMLISDIEKRISDNNDKNKHVDESEMPSFLDFKKNTEKKVDYMTSEEKDDTGYSYNDFISALETIDTTKKPNIIKEEDDTTTNKLKDVNLLVGRFQPFHNGHLKMARQLKEENKLNSIVAIVYPGHNKSGNSPFNEDLINKYMKAITDENSELIDGYFIIKKGLLGIIYGRAKELGYRINLIGAGEDRNDDYKKQVAYLKKAGGDFPEDIKVIETERSTSGTEIRKALSDENYLRFKKLVPSSLKSFYNEFVSIINGKNIKENLNTGEIKMISESLLTTIDANITKTEIDEIIKKEKIKKLKS